MLKHLLPFFLLAAASLATQAQSQAAKLLASMVDRLTGAPSLLTDFTLDEGNGQIAGSIVSSGNCFVITAADGRFQTWFDGKTQWTWTDAANEVNMTEPTAEELFETNPLTIVGSIRDNYTPSLIRSDAASATLRLTPNNPKKGNIKEAEVLLNTKTNFPASLVVKLKDGTTLKIKFSNTLAGNAMAPKEFRYRQSYHPTAEIIDLR